MATTTRSKKAPTKKRPATKRTIRGASRAPKNFDAKTIKRWASLYKKGSTLAEIADEYGCHPTTVRARLLSIGAQLRRPGLQAGTKRR